METVFVERAEQMTEWKTLWGNQADCVVEEKDISAELAREQQAQVNQEAQQYLQETDWYVIRQADSGEPVPEEVKTKRADARERIK